ncbi:glycosyl transferase [Methylobacillus flagellatus]|uniref:glycosyl transferase n=1 Tax=Methylobacillus flagellatus TaxID=405 RepID=UPI002853D660|nr:glycosyl transferase [Methylobacillus flagellatus]MDR5171223.1 glycosyl transferase [Methylobacillus flagellatus]
MDQEVHEQLLALKLPHVSLMRLADFESDALLAVKPGRSKGEYCWTITPFTADWVFSLDDQVKRVTYLDADLLFFNDPAVLFQEFEESGKHVMITEHAYAPDYIHYLETSGRFCVQFMVFDRSPEARRIMQWWQERCLEWCYARMEDGRFGDQKYLDVWPQLFTHDVHILQCVEQTLAPWNVDYQLQQQPRKFKPVFYHFHAFRIIGLGSVRLYEGYRIASSSRYLYDEYLATLNRQIAVLHRHAIPVALLPERRGIRPYLASCYTWLKGLTAKARIDTYA